MIERFKKWLDNFLTIKPLQAMDDPEPVEPDQESYTDLADLAYDLNQYNAKMEIYVKNRDVARAISDLIEL